MCEFHIKKNFDSYSSFNQHAVVQPTYFAKMLIQSVVKTHIRWDTGSVRTMESVITLQKDRTQPFICFLNITL